MKRLLAILLLLCCLGVPGHAQLNPSFPARTNVTFVGIPQAPTITTALFPFNTLVGDTAATGVTTYQVTSGKTLRITAITFSLQATTATANQVGMGLRNLSSGACLVASPVVASWNFEMPPGTLSGTQGETFITIPIPDGLEFTGATRNICVTQAAASTAGQISFVMIGYEY
jgi:hypothetical protein